MPDSVVTSSARLRKLIAVAEDFGGVHIGECPADDTCDCEGKEFNDLLEAAIRRLELLECRRLRHSLSLIYSEAGDYLRRDVESDPRFSIQLAAHAMERIEQILKGDCL